MKPKLLYGPPSATLEILLNDPAEHDFASVQRLLGGLSGEQAVTVPVGLPYSVAALLAHMTSNVRFNLELIRSADPAAFKNPYDTWPTVSAEAWPELVETFFASMSELEQVARDKDKLGRVLYPEAGDEPGWTVGYKLALSVAKHNAYHLGQIALLRRLVGAWP